MPYNYEMEILRIAVGPLNVNCYIAWSPGSKEALVIDPGDEAEIIAGEINRLGLTPSLILLTHAHYDHACAAGDISRLYQAPLALHREELVVYRATKEKCMEWGYEESDFPDPSVLLEEGSRRAAWGLEFTVLHTPGHTPGSICLYGHGVVFSGDTLFRSAVGRTDLEGGSSVLLRKSLDRLRGLPPQTRVLAGHGDATTIGEETARNPFLALRGHEDIR